METGPSAVRHPGIWSPAGWGPLLPWGAPLCSGVILGRGRASLQDPRASGLGAWAGDGHGASALDADVGNDVDILFGCRFAVQIPLCSLGRREKSSPCAASRGAAGRVGAHSSSPPGDAAGSTHAVPRVHLCVLHPSLKKKKKKILSWLVLAGQGRRELLLCCTALPWKSCHPVPPEGHSTSNCACPQLCL